MSKLIIVILILFAAAFHHPATAENNLTKQLQPEQVHEDIDLWLEFLNKTHPQLSYRVEDTERFYADVEKLKNSIDEPLTVLEFWKRISIFNPVLNDGHTVINLSNMKSLANQHVANSGGLFPFSVLFDGNKIIIATKGNGEKTSLRGSVITHINGQLTEDFVKPLLSRIHGDSLRFRKAVLQRKFAEYVWLYYGDLASFELSLDKYGQTQTVTIPASQDPFDLNDVFEKEFKFEILDEQNALLTINTFSWGAEYKDVIAFLHDVFAKVKQNNVQHLIIDIRNNGGGDDAIWIDGIIPYISDKPWKTGSNYKVKIIEGRAKEGQKVGDVLEGVLNDRELNSQVKKFEGDVSVLISDFTYSSSILFANVIQNYQFGVLVGENTGGYSAQTGGIQSLTLTHSKLQAISPRFYLERPIGGGSRATIQPDIAINYDKTIPEQLIYKLINQRNVQATGTAD